MTTPIPMDDLRRDLWVTIRDEMTEVDVPSFGTNMDMDIRQLWRQLRARTPVRPGTPMRVIAVDLPFIYLAVLERDGKEAGPLILDLRRFPVVAISESVPKAILEFAEAKLLIDYEYSLTEVAAQASFEAKAEIVKFQLLGDAMNHDASDDDDNDNDNDSSEDDRDNSDDKTATNRHGHPKNSRPHHDNGDESDGGESEDEQKNGTPWLREDDEEAA
ncbi:MAG: hypothetical protein OSA40_07035 [Phycisphaerales bacterium]|nr:hypothetical protein [Phycisphaerales bacterium]